MRNDKLIVDFTEGNIIKQMLTFSLPFMLSNMMQVLYSFVDMAVVGKYVGPPGLSAVSIASQPMMFITMFCVGITTGGQVNISHQIGRKEYKAVSRTIGTMFSVLAILGVVMMCVGFIGATPMLHILNAPEESFEMAKMYIIVCSAGILFTYGYNMLSAVLRGMGDSKHPFIFIVIASISNVVLDLLFVGVFKMGVQGAALATILGQGISFVFAIVFLFRHKEEFYFDFKPESFRIYRSPFRALIRLGIPFALQGCAINISMMFVGRLVNSMGVQASATFGIGLKVDDFVNKVTQGITFAVSSMVGQNYGAGNIRRVRKIVFYAWGMSFACYIFYIFIYFSHAEALFSIFTEDVSVIGLARVYVSAIVWNYPAMAIMRGSNGFIQGIGNARLGLIFALLDGFVFRIMLSYLFGILLGYGLFGFFLGYGLATYGTAIPGAVYFLFGRWRKELHV